MISSKVKQYSSDIPTYLHERPHNFIKKVMANIEYSKQIMSQDVNCVDHQNGVFTVRSATNYIVYNLHFGNENKRPNCECIDFQQHLIPCKHFFAVIKTFPEWSWTKLPQFYRESKYFTIDSNIFETSINVETNSSTKFNNSAQLNKTDISTDNCLRITKMQDCAVESSKQLNKLAARNRELAKLFANTTYHVVDINVLEKTEALLLQTLDLLQKGC